MAVLVRPAAAADIEFAFRWYEDQRAGLGEEFLGELQSAIASLNAHPMPSTEMFAERLSTVSLTDSSTASMVMTLSW